MILKYFLDAKPKSGKSRKVYETLIHGKNKQEIYLRLSKTTVDDLELKDDEEVTLMIQFQLNRLPLCEMHLAVDKLKIDELVFPDLNNTAHIPWAKNRLVDL